MTTREALEAAKARIDAPEKWSQGTLLDRNGRRCALGAFDELTGVDAQYLYEVLASDPSYGTTSLTAYNDSHTHAEVMALFDRAIASAS
jgi:hypothetical protein